MYTGELILINRFRVARVCLERILGSILNKELDKTSINSSMVLYLLKVEKK